jgi:hypothetical protein
LIDVSEIECGSILRTRLEVVDGHQDENCIHSREKTGLQISGWELQSSMETNINAHENEDPVSIILQAIDQFIVVLLCQFCVHVEDGP